MSVLVDTSVWIAYFRGTGNLRAVDALIDENLLVTNDLLLAELIPPLRIRRQSRLIHLMQAIARCPLTINNVGLPDLIIAQNAIQNGLALFTLDRHFRLMSKHIPLSLH
jgi:hypothetical protein